MRHFSTRYLTHVRHFKYHVIALAIAAVLSACTSPGGGRQEPLPVLIEELQQDLSSDTRYTLPPSEFAAQFLSAEQSLFEFDWMRAESLLATIPAEQTSITDGQYMSYMHARTQYIRGDQTRAYSTLTTLRQTVQNLSIQHRVMSFLRYIDSLSGNYLRSAQLGDQLLRHAPADAESDTLRRNIWRDLQRVQPGQLTAAITGATDQQWLGWLELAEASQGPLGNQQHKQALLQWRDNYPLHPAATALPGGMNYLLDSNTQPKKVAILLPFSGRLAPAAQAIRDGYLAGYYAARAAGNNSLEVDIMDVLAFSSVTEAYQTAVIGGADFVVGPLSKQAVEELGNLADRPVPVLALNRVEATLPSRDTALVQLALAPEDEAVQIASLAFGNGARQALIIRPAGAWGDKMGRALRKQWKKLGGTISVTATYSSREDYSSSMSSAMSLPASEQRARNVRSMLATKVEFSARRRQDLDVVFLLSKSSMEARSLKPLLAYHYASNLPVYATSNIYQGAADARDKDLNSINLVEIPWLLEASSAIRSTIVAGATGSGTYTRLNALGADAYLVQSNFSLLQAGEDMLIRGNTGLLSLTPQLRLERELQSATFDGGALIAH